MKRMIWITVLALAFAQTAYGLILGPPRVVECPKCGAEKGLLSMVSGNTFGAVQWSDLYLDASMMPRLSPVQKCQDCGSYYLLNKAKERQAEYGEDVRSEGTGRLTYAEMKEAMVLLKDDSLTKEDEKSIRMELLHRYNDGCREYDEEKDGNDPDLDVFKRSNEDRKLHHDNIIALISLLDENIETERVLMAELYREAGEYKKCLSILKDFRPSDKYIQSYADKIKSKAYTKENRIFIIE